MLTQYASSMQAADWLGIVMLVLAVASFAAMVVWAFRLPAATAERYGRLPLDGGSDAGEDRR